MRTSRDSLGSRLHRHNSWGLGTVVLGVGTVLSRILGFIREFVMATLFGTSSATDTWLMASVIPNLLFGAVNSALANVVVPIMAGHPGKATPDEKVYVREMMGTVILVSIGLAGIGELFAPLLLQLLAPGFGRSALSHTILLARIMMPTLVLWAGAGLATGVLQAKGIYAPTAGAPAIVNVARIATMLTFGVVDGMTGVAWGFLLAVASQWVYLAPALRGEGFSMRPRFTLRHPWTRQTLRLTLPLMLVTSTGAVGIVVDRILASNLPVGTIAALNYSLLVVQLPLGVLVNSLALPGFTRLSEEWNGRKLLDFRRLLSRGLQMATIITIPSLMFVWFERTPLIAALYQRGAFTGHSTTITAHLVPYWAVALPAFAWSSLLSRAALVLKQTRPITIIGTLTVTVNVCADIVLVHPLGGGGLALGTALAAWVSTGLTWMYVESRTRITAGPTRQEGSPVMTFVVASILLVSVSPLLRATGLTTASISPVVTLLHVVMGGVIIVGVWVAALYLCASQKSLRPGNRR